MHVVDRPAPQPGLEVGPLRVGALEARVGGPEAALGEDGVRVAVQVGVEVGPRRADHAMGRPGVEEVGVISEVVPGGFVLVFRGDDGTVEVPMGADPRRDAAGDVVASFDGEGAARAEVALDVGDDQDCRAGHRAHLLTAFSWSEA